MEGKAMTMTFNAVFGFTPGYGHNEKLEDMDVGNILTRVGTLWQQIQHDELIVSGILVSAVITPGAVVYPTKFGCPAGGEFIIEVKGVLNPKFLVVEDNDDWQRGLRAWKEAVIRSVNTMKAELKQERVTLYFQETASFHYLEN